MYERQNTLRQLLIPAFGFTDEKMKAKLQINSNLFQKVLCQIFKNQNYEGAKDYW